MYNILTITFLGNIKKNFSPTNTVGLVLHITIQLLSIFNKGIDLINIPN